MEVSGLLHAPAALPPQGNSPQYRKLGGSQSHSGHYIKEKNLLPLPGIKPRFLGHSAHNLLCDFLQTPVTSSLLGPNIHLNTLFSNTLSLCSSLNFRDQVAHSYKTTAKFNFVYFKFYDFRQQMRRQKVLN
jgi:hypothetical protein